MSGEIGWTTLDAANTYFLEDRLDSTYWDALTVISGGRDEKSATLKMAYNRLRYSKVFSIPSSPSAAQLEKLAMAQCEMAYYLALHLADEDRRKGLHVQGVVGANIVGETYSRFESDKIDLKSVPIPPIVLEILDEFLSLDSPFAAIDIDRDEDEAADSSVVDV